MLKCSRCDIAAPADILAAPPCANPAPGEPFVDCGIGGHMFDVPVPEAVAEYDYTRELSRLAAAYREAWEAMAFALARGETLRSDQPNGELLKARSAACNALLAHARGER